MLQHHICEVSSSLSMSGVEKHRILVRIISFFIHFDFFKVRGIV